MDRWEPALRKNKSAFSVLGWGRANCDGPYVLTRAQERRGRIRMSSILHQARLRPSWGLSCTEMSCWGCVPRMAKRDAHLLQRVALEHRPCRAFQGEFHSLQGKAMGLKFHELLVREGRTMSAGEERRKSEHPWSSRVSRDTTEMRAMVMTNIRGFSSFGLTASKNL